MGVSGYNVEGTSELELHTHDAGAPLHLENCSGGTCKARRVILHIGGRVAAASCQS